MRYQQIQEASSGVGKPVASCIVSPHVLGQNLVEFLSGFSSTLRLIRRSLLLNMTMIVNAKAGNPVAMKDLFSDIRPRISILSKRLANNIADAEEIEGEAVTRIVSGLDSFRKNSTGAFESWVDRIVRNSGADFYRKAANKRATKPKSLDHRTRNGSRLQDKLLDTGTTPSKRLTQEENARQVREAMQRLDEDDRRVIELRDFDQLKNAEIAGLLGKSEAAAGNQYLRAIQKLKEELRKNLDESS